MENNNPNAPCPSNEKDVLTIRKVSSTNFTVVQGMIIEDPLISLKAKGLYMMINYFITIPNFVIRKQTLINRCDNQKASFQGAWDELKKTGYLKQIRKHNNRVYYEYELYDIPIEEIYTDYKNKRNTIIDKKLNKTAKTGTSSLHTDFQDAENQDTENRGDIISSDFNISRFNNSKNPSFTTNSELKEGLNEINNPSLAEYKQNLLIPTSYNECITYCRELIDYKELKNILSFNDNMGSISRVDDLILLMSEVLLTTSDSIKIGKSTYSTPIFIQNICNINFEVMLGMLEALTRVGNTVNHPRQYLLAVLYNAAINNGALASSIEIKNYAAEEIETIQESVIDDSNGEIPLTLEAFFKED